MRTLPLTLAALLTCPAIAAAAEVSPQTFATKAAATDMFEMEAAKLVIEKGKSAEVKAFAHDMIADHGDTAGNLKEAASEDGVKLPGDMGPELQKKLDSLKPLSGPQLDAAYVSTQVSVHTEAVELFETYSKDGTAPALKGFALRNHPTVRMHLVRARSFNVED